jgi:23S rRNA (guanine745-N1)-methyltransferase
MATGAPGRQMGRAPPACSVGVPLLADVLAYLRCPVCGGALTGDTAVTCVNRHSFDVARQGYVNLLVTAPPAGADTPAMLSARADALASGVFDDITRAVVAAAGTPELAVDAGCGTGHYLAAVLSHDQSVGIALDIAKPAVRRAAQAHPGIGAAVCDIWRGLPVADGCADALLNVFAPRNPAEFHRVLRPGGVLVVVTPEPEHLRELVHGLRLLGLDPGKRDRLDATLAGWFTLHDEQTVTTHRSVDRSVALRLAAMGPSAFHTSPAELADRVAELPEPVPLTISARVAVYRPSPR